MSEDQKQVMFLELMTELTKKNSQSKKIYNLCDQLSIPFNGDTVELMTYVLGSEVIQKNLLKQKNSKTKKKNNEISL